MCEAYGQLYYGMVINEFLRIYLSLTYNISYIWLTKWADNNIMLIKVKVAESLSTVNISIISVKAIHEAMFHVERLWVRGTRICSGGVDHITKMIVMHI